MACFQNEDFFNPLKTIELLQLLFHWRIKNYKCVWIREMFDEFGPWSVGVCKTGHGFPTITCLNSINKKLFPNVQHSHLTCIHVVFFYSTASFGSLECQQVRKLRRGSWQTRRSGRTRLHGQCKNRHFSHTQ